MKLWRLLSILLALAMLPLFPGGNAYAAALGTEFTYQGRLTSGGTAVDQTCGFQFSLFDAVSGGTQQGSTLTKSSVSVSDGLFTVALDFGSSIFTGDATFLNITVRCPDSGTYTSLSPRQELTPTPYSVFATTAGGVQDNDNDTKVQAEETADEDKIRFDTGGSERMIIDDAGLVGIGTTSPTSALTVTSPVSGALQFDPFGTGAGNTGEERFLELAANGSNYVGWKAPDSIATPEIWTLPNADGSSGQVLRTDGSNTLTWVTPGGFSTATLSSATTLSATTEYHTDTSGAAFTATLPSAPADGAAIRIIDVKATFDTNNLTVARGGSDTIEGGTSVTLSTENGLFDLHYDAEDNRWQIAEHDAPAPITLHRARLERAAAQSIGDNTNTKVSLDTETYDVGSIGDPTTNNRIDIAQAGLYLINGGVCFVAARNVQAQLVVGGTIIQRQFLNESSGNGSWCANASTIRVLAASDQVTLQAFQNSGGSLNTITTAGDRPFLEVIQLATSAVAGVASSSIQDDDNDTKIQAEESADEDKIRFDTAGSERMIIDAAGLVGIGTSSPVAPLDVSGVTRTVTLGVSGNATFGDASGDSIIFNADALTFANDTAVTLSGGTDGINFDSNTLSIDAQNDRVGIGSAAPTKGKLEIDQTDAANLQALFVDSLESTFSQSVMTVTTSVTSADNTVFDLDSGGNLTVDGRLESSRVRVSGGVLASGGAPGAFGLNNNGYAFAGGGGDIDSGMFSFTDGQIDFYTNAVDVMRIASSGNVTATGTINGGGLDLAENFLTDDKTLVPGEIVTFDPANATTHVVRASSADSRVLGVVSTDPGLLLGYTFNPDNFDESRLRPVALSGRVPVKVSAKNGTIAVGDWLSISSQPGVANRANPGDQTIGYALEEYSDRGIGEIKVFVNLAQGTQNLQSRVYHLEKENLALKQLVCADHRSAEICEGADTLGGFEIKPRPGRTVGLALWVFGAIGATITVLGTVFLFASRRRPGTTA